jgi:tartrate dehydratase alpha subunit/fumarate hydratase class I-like protein
LKNISSLHNGQFNNRIASAKDIQMYKNKQHPIQKRYNNNNVKSQLHMDIVKNAQKNITLNSQTNHSGSP